MKAKSGSLLLAAIITHSRQRRAILDNITDNHRHGYRPLATASCSTDYTDVGATARTASSYYNDNKTHGGIPIGAVQIGASHAQNFRELVESTLRTTKNRGMEKFIGPRNNINSDRDNYSSLLIHLASDVATALDDGHPELTEFLKVNDGVYIPGLRRSRTHRQATRRRRNAVLPNYMLQPKKTVSASKNTNNNNDSIDRMIDGDSIRTTENTKQQPTTTQLPPTLFDFSELFAGIGGFRLGLEAIGGICVMANEIDPYAASIYRHNFSGDDDDGDDDDSSSNNKHHLIEADILDLCAKTDIPANTDILTAGFPCQPFSTRGNQRGFNDDRGQLYRELVRVLRASRPKSFIFENVAGLVSLGGGSVKRKEAGPVFQTILEAFEECGYDISWRICNSRHFVAQRRERVYIVGMRQDLDLQRKFSWNWYEQIILSGGGSNNNSGDDDGAMTTSSITVRDIMEPPDSLAVADSELSPKQWAKLQEIHSNRIGGVATFASIDIDAKAPTLISSYRRSGSHTSKFIFTERDGTARDVPRYLTPRECCRIQGFPDDFDIPSISRDGDESTAHFYSGIGNAVVPPVVGSIGNEIIACLRS